MGHFPNEEWSKACCEETRGPLELLLGKYGMTVKSVDQDLKASLTEIYLAEVISEQASREIQERFATVPNLSFARHGFNCMICRIGIIDGSPVPPQPKRVTPLSLWARCCDLFYFLFSLAAVVASIYLCFQGKWKVGIPVAAFFGLLLFLSRLPRNP